MLSVLVLSHDDGFRLECAEALKQDGYQPFLAANENGVAELFEGSDQIDAVILNADQPDEETHRVLDYLTQFRPRVSVLLLCDSFNYWNDFFTWLADCCLVTPLDKRGLCTTIGELIAGRERHAHKPEADGFAVEWNG